jgi:hypothetical protein
MRSHTITREQYYEFTDIATYNITFSKRRRVWVSSRHVSLFPLSSLVLSVRLSGRETSSWPGMSDAQKVPVILDQNLSLTSTPCPVCPPA